MKNAEVNTTKKATVKKSTKSKEDKVMKKEVVTEVKNEEKVNTMLTIEQVVELYKEFGIKCYNPNAKGPYRIMGTKSGSSLNLTKVWYTIYSNETDYQAIVDAKIEADDLVLSAGDNSQDTARKNTVKCRTVETLKLLLAVYAKNVANLAVQK